MPMMIGVPTAPKVTAVLWMISAEAHAARGGKPSATSSGPATAAGVPKPAAPSINDPNSQATINACTRASGEMS